MHYSFQLFTAKEASTDMDHERMKWIVTIGLAWIIQIWVSIPTLLFTTCKILDESFHLSEPQFSPTQKWE